MEHKLTIIFSEEDKQWLDEYAQSHQLSISEVVQKALQEFKQRHLLTKLSQEDLYIARRRLSDVRSEKE